MATKTISNDCVIAVFDRQEDAISAVNLLIPVQVPSKNISIITRSGDQQLSELASVNHDDVMERNAGLGAAAGATFGLLAGATLTLIPGIGPVIFAGALASGMTGGIVGGIVGAMSGWGIKEDLSQEYEKDVNDGKTVVIVHGEPEILSDAKTYLEQLPAAKKVVLHAESADAKVDA